ncbi:MAG: DUF1858 domain-containing protein [candidate division KSB1 bacterium]|nr:DUF1858 domain-containing protein [candidate division KSB1 bacterium]MDZ7342860.1 DUF1858 domain-containing protein [candidate division KSB1 bacterium]
MTKITTNISIEELVTVYPAAVPILLQKGIQCIVCGEPVWGTLGDVISEKGFSGQEAVEIANDLNQRLNSEERK